MHLSLWSPWGKAVAWPGMYIYFKMPLIMSRSRLDGLRHARLKGMNLVQEVQMCTSLDHWVWGVGFSLEGSMLMATAGRVSLSVLSEGSLEVVAFFYFSSIATRDGWVVFVVPLGIHWGPILTRFRYTGLVHEGASIEDPNWRGLWTSLLRLDWTRGLGVFMLFLHLLLLGDNFFFFLLLLGLLPGLDLALLLPKNPLYLFSKAKGL